MTVYNAETTIGRAVQSILKQRTDDVNIEFILVNDGSTDSSMTVAERLISERPDNSHIAYKSIELSENMGCGYARAVGIDAGTGDYFMFLDADDYYINADFVHAAVITILENNADIVEYGVRVRDLSGRLKNSVVKESFGIENNPKQALISLYKENAIKFNVWNKIYTRKIVLSYPYSREREFEDVRTIPQWLMRARKIVIINSVEVNYSAQRNSIVNGDRPKSRLGTVKAIAETLNDINDKDVIKAMYERALVDISGVMDGKTSLDSGFDEMAQYNNAFVIKLFGENHGYTNKELEHLL
jgi:glycosyltransferase involved in cell wall biosynthesis